MGILQAIVMPLFFTSNALHPIEIMPAPLQAFAKVNPMTYIISSLRDTLIYGDIVSAINGLLVTLVFSSIVLHPETKYLQKIVE